MTAPSVNVRFSRLWKKSSGFVSVPVGRTRTSLDISRLHTGHVTSTTRSCAIGVRRAGNLTTAELVI